MSYVDLIHTNIIPCSVEHVNFIPSACTDATLPNHHSPFTNVWSSMCWSTFPVVCSFAKVIPLSMYDTIVTIQTHGLEMLIKIISTLHTEKLTSQSS